MIKTNLEQVSQTLLTLHFKIELWKLEGLTVEQAVEEHFKKCFEDAGTIESEMVDVVRECSPSEIQVLRDWLGAIFSEVDKQMLLVSIGVTTDPNGIATAVNIDKEFALEFIPLFQDKLAKLNDMFLNVLNQNKSDDSAPTQLLS